jgi:hypothetical protein
MNHPSATRHQPRHVEELVSWIANALAMKKLPSALLHAAPVAVTALCGAWWITAHTGGGRDSAHTLWQSLALAETLLALLLRERKPAGALVGILAAYLLFALDPLLLPGVLFALLTIATTRHRQTVVLAATATAAAIAAMPYIHGGPVSFPEYILPRLAAAGAAVAAGLYLRARQDRRTANPAGEREPGGMRTGSGTRGPR